MAKSSLFLLVISLILTACGSDSSSTSGSSNPMQQLANEARNHISSSLPRNGGASLLNYSELSPLSTPWTETRTGLKRPGNSSSSDISISDYVTDVLNPDYIVVVPDDDDFAPTVFSRLQEEMKILITIGAQVPFSGGVPQTGTHTVTPEGMSSFEITITTPSDTTTFDVLIDAPTIDFKAALRNNSNVANLVTADGAGSSYGLVSRLFWNKQTGEMSYDLISASFTGSNLNQSSFEVQRLYIEETNGRINLAHIYGNNYLAISAANSSGGASEEMSVSYQSLGSPVISRIDFCASTSTNSATNDSLCSLDHSDSRWLNTLQTAVDDQNSSQALHELLYGGSYANMESAQIDFGTDQDSFLSSIGN